MQRARRLVWLLFVVPFAMLLAGGSAVLAYPAPTVSVTPSGMNYNSNVTLFSGTCGCVTAVWTVGEGARVTQVEIYVNDVRVLDRTSWPGCVPPPAAENVTAILPPLARRTRLELHRQGSSVRRPGCYRYL